MGSGGHSGPLKSYGMTAGFRVGLFEVGVPRDPEGYIGFLFD